MAYNIKMNLIHFMNIIQNLANILLYFSNRDELKKRVNDG